jgi:small subunit ribosomal protein S1
MNAKQTIKSFSADDFANALARHDYEFKRGQIVKGKVVSHDSFGAYVDIGGKSPGFLPVDEAFIGSAANLAAELPIDDTEREFAIVSEQDENGQVKLSIRKLMMLKAWANLRSYQEEGQTFNCRVVGTNKGGVTVDAEGIRGFIPRSHLVEKNNLAGLVGQSLPVTFIELDESRNKLVLSHRLAARASAMTKISRGILIDGIVSNLRPFGAFVDFDGVSGMLHVKEISQKYVGDINSVFQIGDPVTAVVVDVDESRDRISLSTKLLELTPGEMLDNREQVFAEAEARLEKNIQKLWNT